MLIHSSMLMAFTLMSLVSASSDPCADLATALGTPGTASASHVAACYAAFPYSASIASSTLDTIGNHLESYAFLDLANDVPDASFVENYDLPKALAEIRSKTYANDWEFHFAVQKALRPLRDGHVGYDVECYGQFTFLQPFFMEAIQDEAPSGNGEGGARSPIVRIQSVDANYTTFVPPNAPPVAKYAGWKIESIDATPAATFLQSMADTIWSYAKDPNTRFNRMLAYKVWDDAKKNYRVARGSFASRATVPEKNTVTYALVSPEGETATVEVPWAVKYKVPEKPISFKDKDEYWSKYCVNAPKEDGGIETMPVKTARREQEPVPVIDPGMTTPPQFLIKPLPDLDGEPLDRPDPTPLVTGPGFAFFVHPDNPSFGPNVRVGIYTMTGFNGNSVALWKRRMLDGLDAFKKNNVTHMIMDMSSNGGGSICTAYRLVRLLTRTSAVKIMNKAFTTDLRVSKAVRSLIETAWRSNVTDTMFHPTNFVDAASESVYNSLSWINPGKTRMLPHGQTPAIYSSAFTDDCDHLDWDEGTFTLPLENVAFLTNGMCASSCSLVANQLHEFAPQVKQFAMTAWPSGRVGADPTPGATPATISCMPGGQVYRNSLIASDFAMTGITPEEGAPKALPLKGEFSWTIREAYSRKDSDVLEYKRVVADGVIRWREGSSVRVEEQWKDVVKAAGWMHVGQNEQGAKSARKIPSRRRVLRSV